MCHCICCHNTTFTQTVCTLCTVYYTVCDQICETQQNLAGLNLQYKLLITMCKILAYLKNCTKNFVSEEGSSVKNLDTILFAYSRGAWKSYFHCSGLKNTWVMAVCWKTHHDRILNEVYRLWDYNDVLLELLCQCMQRNCNT